MDCTRPFPQLVWPAMTARSWSCSAPATISDADAEPLLRRTTTGMREWVFLPGAEKLCSWAPFRPRVTTTFSLFARKKSDTAMAWSRRPPGFPRRSKTSSFMPCFSSFSQFS